jgi:hypothetical protein
MFYNTLGFGCKKNAQIDNMLVSRQIVYNSVNENEININETRIWKRRYHDQVNIGVQGIY